MTLVATWLNLEGKRPRSIWTAADTKITATNAIILEGSKVFELLVVCRSLSTNYGMPMFTSSLGFAYAGNTLIGQNVFATLSTVLSNLGAGNGSARPDCYSITNAAKVITKLYSASIRELAEISIWGFCPKSNRPFISSIKAEFSNGQFDYTVSVKDRFTDDLNFILLGCHLQDVEALIAEELSKHKTDDYRYWRSPITVINNIIRNERYPEIGGNIQLATIDEGSFFRHYAVINIQQTNEPMLYRNINLQEELGARIGDCLIAVPALMINEPSSPQS